MENETSLNNETPPIANVLLGVVLLPEETVEEAASRLWGDCYPNWLDNGLVVKKAVARNYAKMIVNGIIKETLDEYTNDENHVRIEFWEKVLIRLDEAY